MKSWSKGREIIVYFGIDISFTWVICVFTDYAEKKKSNHRNPLRTGTKRRPYVCTTCGKSFQIPCCLARHQRIHTGEKPFQCSTCGKAFACQGNRKKHEAAHHGEKTVQLRTCPNLNLKSKSKSESKEKLHVCPTCGKGFTTVSNLGSHQRIHTGQKDFQGSLCVEKPFQQKAISGCTWWCIMEKSHTSALRVERASRTEVI